MKPKLLLHVCCAPCASAIIEHLSKYYDITLYFCNPNILEDLPEYNRRLNEVINLIDKMGLKDEIKIVEGLCEYFKFEKISKNLENSHEGGNRCKCCYALRLQQTAKYASTHGFTEFATTLTISPYKDSAVINSIGTKVASDYPDLMYMPFDFGFLYTRSLDLCKEYNLYQQDYCGCKYSKKN